MYLKNCRKQRKLSINTFAANIWKRLSFQHQNAHMSIILVNLQQLHSIPFLIFIELIFLKEEIT